MEAVKNGFACIGRNAGTFVVDPDTHLVANAGSGDLHQASRWREAYGIVDDVVYCPSEAVGLSHNRGRVLAWTSEGDARVTGLPPRFPAGHELLDERAQVDPVECGARELRICSGSLADVVYQSVDPPDVFAGDRHQAMAKRVVLDAVEALHGRTQRGEWVFELVSHVGSEGLHVVDPLTKRLAHV